ncbi:MAG TPA: O-antigen ligase family protein [Chlamydiales bacterium]|nr:O-antigen ligase family protein [Chlamydiales bacterium]
MLWRRLSIFLTCLIAFIIPIEHKYDKLFRHFSLKLIPNDIVLPKFFDKKIYFYPSDLIAVALLLIALFALRIPCRHFFGSRGAGFLWIIFVFAFLSIPFSPLANYPLPYIRLLQLSTPFILYSFLANSFSLEEKTRLITRIFQCIVFAACIQSVIAIAQFAIQGPIGLRLLGEQSGFAHFAMPAGHHRWLFCLKKSLESIIVIRSYGTFPHTNVLGGFLACSILASYSLCSKTRVRFFLILLQFFAMSLTFSRSAFFGWALGTLVWFAFSIRDCCRMKASSIFGMILAYFRSKSGDLYTFCRYRSPLFDRKSAQKHPKIDEAFIRQQSLTKQIWDKSLIFTLFISVCISWIILHEPILHRGGIVNYTNLNQESDGLRIRYQTTALSLIKTHPFLGVGFHQLATHSQKYISNDPTYPIDGGVHNIYLYLAVETGLFSLMAFCIFIFFILYKTLQTPATPQVASLLAIFIAFLFIGGCDFYPLLFQQGKLIFFLTSGLLAATHASKKLGIA